MFEGTETRVKGVKKTNERSMYLEAEEAIRSFGTLEKPDCNFISSLIKELLDKVKKAYENRCIYLGYASLFHHIAQ